MTNCIFCKIIEGTIPSAKVYEDEHVCAFLDITQVTPGHTLVIPKTHVANIFEYDEKLIQHVWKVIPAITRALQKSFPTMQGLNILNNNHEVAGQTVFHSHFHLLPRYSQEDGFSVTFTPDSNVTPDLLTQRATLIASHCLHKKEVNE